MNSRLLLTNLSVGEKATIVSIHTGIEMIGQLMGMGLFIGTRIEILQTGRSHKPVLLSVEDSRIVLGQELANLIQVERDSTVLSSIQKKTETE
ncbi:MAG: FeoA family protein [Planctomycetia bacterium]|nr:FeoA family protein [Planctomycetia bacterium]